MANIPLFSQIISRLDRHGFNKIVKKRDPDKHQKGYTRWTHLIAMLFCSRWVGTNSQSVRDISNGLRSATGNGNLNHMGVERAPAKSTISYQTARRDWRLFQD